MILLEWKSGNRNPRLWLPILFVTLICLIHTLFGIHLAYPTKEQFIKLNLEFYPESEPEIQVYKHSIRALLYYLNSVIEQLTTLPNVIFSIMALTAIPVLIKHKTSIRFLALAPVATLILPLGTYVYGITFNTQAEKHMEYVIMLPPLAAYSTYMLGYLKRLTSQISALLVAMALISLCVFSGFSGKKLHGNYEIAWEGESRIPWNHLAEVKTIISREIPKDYSYSLLTTGDNLIFTILDVGLGAYRIDLAEDPSKYIFDAGLGAYRFDLAKDPSKYISPLVDYDIILIPKEDLVYFSDDKLNKYRLFKTVYNGYEYQILIKKSI
jgi:hypothetical protein